ncbi:tyrosine-protein phosphatase [Amycolatopsis lurida]|uniref:tyrosine-protein phosphatase n=1 Tax=Amycolatopsis lurida TaxID=31959 RepID=UPI0037A61DDC
MGWLPQRLRRGRLALGRWPAGPFGALFRSDSHNRLTAEGIAAVRRAGIGRILDLRWARETMSEPSPFAVAPVYRNTPLIAEPGRTRHDHAGRLPDHARRNQRRIADVFVRLGDAPPGPLAVHCTATILRMLAHLNDRHGGVRTYLLQGGATHARLGRIRNRLLSS